MVSKRRRSRLPVSIQQELVRRFVVGASVRSAAELCGVNRNTAILYFHKLRELIAENLAADALDLMAGEIEVDKSCSGGVRKGKRGPGAGCILELFRATAVSSAGRWYCAGADNAADGSHRRPVSLDVGTAVNPRGRSRCRSQSGPNRCPSCAAPCHAGHVDQGHHRYGSCAW